jgi:hypothetical protein
MSDEQKFQIAAKLCQEILAPIVDGQLPYDACSEVLYDSLVLLASKDIKLTAKSSNVAQSTEEEEQEEAINAAKDKLLSKVSNVYFTWLIFVDCEKKCARKYCAYCDRTQKIS